MAKRPSSPVDRERLVAASFAVLEREGLAGLSMRKVAACLHVQAPAVYWHVVDKAELLSLMAHDIYASAYAGVTGARDWQDWLRRFGLALRAAFARHRDGAYLCAIAKPSRADPQEQAQRITAPLVALGLERSFALSGQNAVIAYTLGSAMCESNSPLHDFLDRLMNFEENFLLGLDAIIAGLDATRSPIASSLREAG